MLRSRPGQQQLLHPSQRRIWSYASDLVAWMRQGVRSENLDGPMTVTTPPPGERGDSLLPRLSNKRVLRPQLPPDVPFPTFQRSVDSDKRKGATSALSHFLQQVKQVPTSKQLLETWQIVSQCRPFVLHPTKKGAPLQVRLASADDVGDKQRPWMLQLVPGDVFAEFTADTSARSMVVGTTGADLKDADVVVANETLVLGNLVKAFHEMKEHELAMAFFEAYDHDRSVWLQKYYQGAAADVEGGDDVTQDEKEDEGKSRLTGKRSSMERITQQPRAVYSCYLRSLAALKQSKKIVRLFEEDKRQLERICSTVPNLRVVVRACYSEKNGELARRAIDTIATFSPAAVISLGCYELAIRANLRDRNRGERELLSAVHLSRALHNDGGYILKPDIWSGLIKVSMRMSRPDLALEVFKTYPRHCIPEHQANFRQVLLTACRHVDSTVLEMMQFRWASHDGKASNTETLPDERKVSDDGIHLDSPGVRGSSTGTAMEVANISAADNEAETVLLNAMLWLMLNQGHDVSSLVQVIDIMEATCSKAGATALQRTVSSMFEYDMSQNNMLPRAAIESSLKFWTAHSSVLCGQGFLVRLLLENCVKHQWDDECEMLVDHLLDIDVARLPVSSITKLMETNESRGRFEVNARIGDKLLQKLSLTNRHKLRDDFYEHYLMSCLRLEQFDKVSKLHAKFKLEKRYPFNEVIRTIVRDAAAREG
uniref:Uncharacterized protein n=1 Tax=Hyaloperonospora arabidopsidis (strain Emoy2) TaxID=559515 RepID=M4BRI9_HYAAE